MRRRIKRIVENKAKIKSDRKASKFLMYSKHIHFLRPIYGPFIFIMQCLVVCVLGTE